MFVMALKNGERKMNQFVPKLFDCVKSYTKEQFVKMLFRELLSLL